MTEVKGTNTEIRMVPDHAFAAAVQEKAAVQGTGQVQTMRGPNTEPLPTRLREVNGMLHDPEVDTKEIIDLITEEVGEISAEMTSMRDNPDFHNYLRLRMYGMTLSYIKQLKDLVLDGDAVSKRDELNLEGEKLKKWMNDNFTWLTEAMKRAGIMEELRNGVWRNFRDIAAEKEPTARKEIQQMGSATRRK